MKKITVNTEARWSEGADAPECQIILETITITGDAGGTIDTIEIHEPIPRFADYERTHATFVDIVRRRVCEWNKYTGAFKPAETVIVDYGEHFAAAGEIELTWREFRRRAK